MWYNRGNAVKRGVVTMGKVRCYTYTRVSTAMQVDGYSLNAQRDKLQALYEMLG